METIDDILLQEGVAAGDKVARLKAKTIIVPQWDGATGLVNEYDPSRHPVMNRAKYPDIVQPIKGDNGETIGVDYEHVTRVTYDFQRLAVKRMTELICGVPVKRVYSPQNDKQAEVAKYMEAVFQRNRIDGVNVDRLNMLFACCEVMTLWYSTAEETYIYGFRSPLKMRCRSFSPMKGERLFPYFNRYGDLEAMSVEYRVTEGELLVTYFDTYTKDRHMKWRMAEGGWEEVENEEITIGKIPCVYVYRPTPIWENSSDLVYEMEWTMSRTGNYIRQNAKPKLLVVYNDQLDYGEEGSPNQEFKTILQLPQGSDMKYVTWEQSVESTRFFIEELKSAFFSQLQLPNWSYEKMSQQALSGESRKQLFIDAQMKVKDESGRLLEFFDREVNVVKAFMKAALGAGYEQDIDALNVDTVITPFSISDEQERINELMTATAGKPIMSQREAIERFGYSDDVDRTMRELYDEQLQDATQSHF